MSARHKRRMRRQGVVREHRFGDGRRATMFTGPPPGPNITRATDEEVLAVLERFDAEAPWASVGQLVVPQLPRQRPFPIPTSDQVTVTLPPGIEVAFGVDLGPALAFVAEQQLQSWGIDRATLVAAALDNVRSIAVRMHSRDVRSTIVDGIPMRVVQSGYAIASALLLVPDALPHLVGRGPNVLLAPMRDILIALPADVDRAYAEEMAEGLASLDPNGLHLGLFRHHGDRVVREADDHRVRSARQPAGLMMH